MMGTRFINFPPKVNEPFSSLRFLSPTLTPRCSLWQHDFLGERRKRPILSRPKEEYDGLIYQVATLEAELAQTREFLEAPGKRAGWWAGGAWGLRRLRWPW